LAKRHHLVRGSWESILGRLEELVLANSGEDEFQEIFKLLLAKVYAESHHQSEGLFATAKTPEQTARNIDDLLGLAARQWKGVLEDAPTMRLRPDHIAVCVEAIEHVGLLDSNLEVLDALFEDLMSKSSKGAKGQYFTPRYVVDCCVKLVDPKPSETVMDPACGSAGFLIHTLTYVKEQNPSLDLKEYARSRVWGADFDPRAIQVARALMLVVGDGHSNLLRINSLLTPTAAPDLFDSTPTAMNEPTLEDLLRTRWSSFSGFDVIMTNPPFAGEVREPELLGRYQLARKSGRTERDILFLERCLSLLRPGGRLAIVLPHNKFASSVWAYARQWLIQRAQIVAVLGLGRYTFLPHTSQKAAILFLRKRDHIERSPDKEPILFLLSERDGKNSKGEIIPRGGVAFDAPAWVRADHDLSEVVPVFSEFIEANGIEWATHG
jgi:type I restriction enzyme M protein